MTAAQAQDALFAARLADSFSALSGRPLVPGSLEGAEAAEWLYRAPFVLLAHDASPDPLFVYANLTAQRVFGYSWDEFVGLPSRLSAGETDRESRRIFMESVARNGYSDDYRGRRVTKAGRHFWIEQGTIWNLTDDCGRPAGQAAMIPRWSD